MIDVLNNVCMQDYLNYEHQIIHWNKFISSKHRFLGFNNLM